MSESISTVRAIVTGRVQGVGFRMWTQRAAEQLGVRGWVRNLADGSVEALVAGSREQVDEMLAALKRGPALSRVDAVETSAVEGAHEEIEEEFQVRY